MKVLEKKKKKVLESETSETLPDSVLHATVLTALAEQVLTTHL